MMLPMIAVKPMLNLCKSSCGNGFLDALKTANDFCFPADGYVCNKDSITLGVRNPSNAAGVVRPAAKVPHIPNAINGSQVAPSVVKPVSVYVVNFLRDFTSLHKPNDAVCHKSLAKHSYTNVAIGSTTASRLASVLSIPNFAGCLPIFVSTGKITLGSFLPVKQSGIWIVIKRTAKGFPAGQFKIGHSGLLNRLFDLAGEALQKFSSAHLFTRDYGVAQ
jgi:hypothetical protein